MLCLPSTKPGFQAQLLDSPEADFTKTVQRPDLCVVDCRDGPSRQALERFLRCVPVTAVIDDASERRLAADFAYYPPVPQVAALSWQGSTCTVRVGWEWAILGVSQILARPRIFSPRPTLLVAMGGSDPYGLTLRVANALATLDPVFRARFVVGPGFEAREKTAREIIGLRSNFETIEGATDLMTEYASADVRIGGFWRNSL